MFITEVTHRCDFTQGVLQPFVCRLDGEAYYYAKGSNSGVLGLINEWIAANLAAEFGLPTPACAIAYLDPTLKDVLQEDWLQDLEFEHLFASKSVSPCDTVRLSDVRKIPDELQRDVFVFDYWINNEDRHLGEAGGNVNLLFQPGAGTLQVIDFNLAFDSDFSLAKMDTHVFRPALERLPIDLDCRSRYAARFDQCISRLDEFISLIPDEWIDYTPSSSAIVRRIRETLEMYDTDDFWGPLL